MQKLREPAVADLFYPGSSAALSRALEDCFRLARQDSDVKNARALIVPHAGLQYSGPIAASAYQLLKGKSFERILLLGPNHYVGFRGVAAPSAAAFATPFGDIPVDQEFIRRLIDKGLVMVSDRAHEQEHCLEVQLPFLQKVLGPQQPSIIPLLVGDDAHDQVIAILDEFSKLEFGLTVISSDLSHYESYERALKHDQRTAQEILQMSWREIHGHDACGANALAGFLDWADGRNAKVIQLDLRNSGDTSGSRDRVVGYGSFAVEFN